MHHQRHRRYVGHRNGSAARLQADALQGGRCRPPNIEGDGAQRLTELGQRKARAAIGKVGPTTRLGRAVQRHTHIGGQAQPGACACAACHQAGKTQTGQNLQVLDLHTHVCTGFELVHFHGELLAHHQDQVKTCLKVHLDLALGLGRELKALVLAAKAQLDGRAQRRDAVRKAQRYTQLACFGVVAGAVVAQQARLVERSHELVDGLDALERLVHAVGLRLGLDRQGLRQCQCAAIFRHGADLHHLLAHADPKTLHGLGKLGRLACQGQAIGAHPGQARGALGLPQSRRPGHQRTVEVHLVHHRRLEGISQVQQVGHGLLHEGQVAQAQRGRIDGLQVLQHLRQGGQHVDQTELPQLGQLLKVLGLQLHVLEQITFNGDQWRQGRTVDELNPGNRAIHRQLHLDHR